MPMKVLVTGGAGFIGSHVVDALVARGDAVVVLDNFDDFYDPRIKERNLAGSPARLIRGDIRDEGAVRRAVEGCDGVIHLAARAGVRESLDAPLLYQDINVAGTATVLDVIRREGRARFVFAGSSSVYGACLGGAADERANADRPLSPYSATKRAGELLACAAHEAWGVPATCLRFFTVYGPRQRPTMAIARFVDAALSGRALTLYGDGSSERDYTWVHDIVRGTLAALDRASGYEIINLGSGRPIRLDGLVDAVGRATGREPIIERLPDQAGDVPRTHASIEHAAEVLDWRPTTTLDEGLAAYVDWLGRR